MKKKVIIAVISTIVATVVFVAGIIWWQRPSDVEVLYAAGQVKFLEKDHDDILKHNVKTNYDRPGFEREFDIDLYTEWARQDPKVQAQIKDNRRNR